MPLIDREIIPWLRLGHGLYNTTIIILFFPQAWMGLRIRRARKAGAPIPIEAVKKHRQRGPVLALLGIIGFFIGLTVVTLDQRNYLEYWQHLVNGSAIVMLLAATYAISKKIKGPDSPYRVPHFIIGIILLVLYLYEALLGAGILF